MKRLISVSVLILGWAAAAWAAGPVALTTLQAVHSLSNADASKRLPVAFEATVTYYRAYEQVMFVQDNGLGIYVEARASAPVVPGDRVLVSGTTRGSFKPFVVSDKLTLIRHGALPTPVSATFGDLIQAKDDCLLVTVRGILRAADLTSSAEGPFRSANVQLLTDGGYIDAAIDTDNAAALRDLLDAEVEITGAEGGTFDGKMQQTGIDLHVSSVAGIKVLQRPGANPWDLPVTPMDRVLAGYHVRTLTPRIRVQGTITYYQPGSAIVLQNGVRSLWIMTQTHLPLRIGDWVDATGIPDVNQGSLTLTHGEIHDRNIVAPVTPLPVTWSQLALNGNVPVGHQYDLVSIEGKLVMEVREAAQDEYVLLADGHLFSAIYRHPEHGGAIPLSEMKQIPLGSRIRVTGICMIEGSNSFNGQVAFNLLLRSSGDIAIVAGPSWLSVRNLILLVSVLIVAIFVVIAWGWTLEHKNRRQTAALAACIEAEAALERRRSRILEDINASRPLSEIIEQIAEMVSVGLKGAPCWCQIAEGAQLGSCPPDTQSLRVIRQEISGHSGASLGTLFVGLEAGTAPATSESDALSLGAQLASLAIETRKIYTDLRRRSEFDLLTDIHNRFSLDKHLDTLIKTARETAALFGLIYIDLDRFKQVNDLYGHRIGDLYLQEVSQRMKRQLRGGDLLARLGGDEFAALVTAVHGREDIEEIASRLEHCFDDPFVMEGYALHGSASLGLALYPEDGTTKDNLLSAADATMYVAKHCRRQSADLPAEQQDCELSPDNRS